MPRIEVVERARHRVVLAGLVEEPLARPVDDDAARPGALESHAAAARLPVDGVAGDLDDRHPPRLAHVGQVGAVRHRHPQPVAGVVRWRHRTVHRAAQVGLDERRVPLEAAGAEHDAAAGAHANVLAADARFARR